MPGPTPVCLRTNTDFARPSLPYNGAHHQVSCQRFGALRGAFFLPARPAGHLRCPPQRRHNTRPTHSAGSLAMSTPEFRTEHDSLGPVQVPAEALRSDFARPSLPYNGAHHQVSCQRFGALRGAFFLPARPAGHLRCPPQRRHNTRPTHSAGSLAMSTPEFRTEHDSLGPVQVPAEALYGAQTQRAVDNFRLAGQPLDGRLIVEIARIKGRAARASAELGLLDQQP